MATDTENNVFGHADLLSALLDLAPSALYAVDTQDRFLFVNKQLCKTVGQPREKLIGASVSSVMNKDQLKQHEDEFRRAMEEGQGFESEMTYPTPYGTRHFLLQRFPLRDGAGKIAAMGSVGTDITRIHEAENAREAALRELKAAHVELETFSYSVSHDLRAPLRAMAGFAKILEEDHASALNEEGRDFLKRIQAAAAKMGELVDGLLELSRLGRKDLEMETLDLSAMALELGQQAARLYSPREVSFEVQPGLNAKADARLARTALQNLIENAWKFTAHVKKAKVEFFRQSGVEGGAFVVRDNGAGFDMAYADRLFGAFQRLHTDHEFSGMGIGLATVARVVARHGGRAWAEGKPGQGASFYFTLG